MVREIFRNLVTAQGTRAVRSVEDLLSVFDSQGVGAGFTPARDAAEETLHNLIGARLLTSFEEEGAEGNGHSRVEVVHESLLSSWPRLVRWQTQDADAGELRDQLRQAARTWHEHDRTVDFLWTGKAFREFSVWWENYPGGLSAVEEDFAAAMTAHAKRRKRLRRVAVSTLIAALLAGLAIVGSFWRESVHATRRAEATKLLALGQLELDDNPTAAAAHAVASLDLSESPEARRLALDALWRGPPATFVSGEASGLVQFTSDGRWLVQSFNSGDRALRLLAADGSSDVLTATERHGLANSLWFEDGSIFQTHIRNPEDQYTTIALWSAKERRELARARFERGQETGYSKAWSDDQMMVLMSEGGGRISLDTLGFDGEHRRLGTRDLVPGYRDETSGIRSNWGAGRLVASTNGHEIYVSELSETGLSEPRLVGRQPDPVSRLEVDALDRFVASGDKAGRIRMWDPSGILPPDVIQGPRDMIDLWVSHNGRFMQANSWPDRGDLEQWIWSLDGERPELLRRINLGEAAPMLIGLLDPVGRQVAHHGVKQKVHVWKLSAPADAEPIELLQGDYSGSKRPCFHPGGTWLVTPDANGLRFWPLTWPTPLVISQHDDGLSGLVFGPVGRWLASSSNDGTVKIWPLDGEAPPPGRLVFDAKGYVLRLARSPKGDRLLATAGFSGVHVISVGEEAPRRLPDSDERRGVAFSPDGRLAAAVASRQAAPDIGIWDVDSGQRIALLTHEGSTIFKWPHFVDQGTLLAVDQSGLRRWDIETGDSELAHEGSFVQYDATRDGRRAILVEAPPSTDLRRAIFIDLETGEKKPLESHGNGVCRVALDPSGTIAVTGDTEGTVRVGPVTGEEPHLFVGHEQRIGALAVDPSGRWIASGSGDNMIRLWPMPDLSKTPLHTLPREKLMAKLKTLTNLRVVRDADSSTGWKLELGPFPGWETVPEW
jgi:WD40 repeat protein